MLVSELEPGSLFKLTADSHAFEVARLKNKISMIPTPGAVFELLAPASGPAEPIIVAPGPGHSLTANFFPDGKNDYSVERVEAASGLGKRNLASRAHLMTSCDPEVFLENEAGQIVPGFSVLPPKKTPGGTHHGGLFHDDGYQAEFSPTPFSCHERVVTSMTHTLQDMMGRVNGMGLNYNTYGEPQWLDYTTMPIKISDKSFVEMSPELLASGTDDQVALGCDTSENVWGHAPFTHDNPRQFPYRMAGGHIHFGTPSTAPWLHARAERIIKAMDVFCGVPSVALFAEIDDPRRRQFYGRAGEYRLQKHGLEYRTLSNVWLQHPSLTHLTFNLARAAFRIGMLDWEETFKFDSGLVRHIINEHDVEASKKFIEENAGILIWALNQDSSYGWGKYGLSTLYDGAKKVFGEKLGIQKTWLTNRTGDLRFNHFAKSSGIRQWPMPEEMQKTSPPPPVFRPTPPIPMTWTGARPQDAEVMPGNNGGADLQAAMDSMNRFFVPEGTTAQAPVPPSVDQPETSTEWVTRQLPPAARPPNADDLSSWLTSQLQRNAREVEALQASGLQATVDRRELPAAPPRQAVTRNGFRPLTPPRTVRTAAERTARRRAQRLAVGRRGPGGSLS